MKCVWCDSEQAIAAKKDCHWIEPGGADAIVVTDVPAIHCPQCRDIYTDDEINLAIEAALNMVDLSLLGTAFSYDQLMKAPKRSLFDLYQSEVSFRCNRG